MKYLLYILGFGSFMWFVIEMLWWNEIILNFDVSGEIALGKYNFTRRILLPGVLSAIGIFGAEYFEKSEENKLSKDTKDKLDDTLDKF